MSEPLSPEVAAAVQRGKDLGEFFLDEVKVLASLERIYLSCGYGAVLAVISRAMTTLATRMRLDHGLVEITMAIADVLDDTDGGQP